MKPNKYLAIILLVGILTLIAPITMAQPIQVASWPNPVQLTHPDSFTINVDDIFNDWTLFQVAFYDPIAGQSITMQSQIGGNDQFYYTDHLDVEVYAFSDTVFLQITTRDTTLNTEMFVTVNDNQFNAAQTSFILDITGAPTTNSPVQIASFPDPLVLGFNDFEYYLMSNYFRNFGSSVWDEIQVSFNDPIASQTVQLNAVKGGSDQFYTTSYLEVYLQTFSNNIALDIQSFTDEFGPQTFTITAINNDGSTSDTFSFEIQDDTPPGNGDPPPPPPPSGGVDLLNGLVSYYKFDETSGTTASDSAGSNHGTLIDNPSFISEGKINGGINIPSSELDSRVDITGASFANNDFLRDSWSINFWGIVDISDNNIKPVFRFGSNSNGNERYQLLIIEQDLVFERRTVNSLNQITISGQLDSNTPSNNYTMITLAHDGDDNYQFYVNGQSISTSKGVVGNPGSPNIGRAELFNAGLNLAYPFRNDADEFGVWGRNLNENEILGLYNSGSGLQYPFSVSPAEFPPESVSSFPNPLNLGYEQQVDYNLNQFFNDYDEIQISFNDPITAQTAQITTTIGGSQMSYTQNHLGVSLTPTTNTIILSIESFNTDFQTEFTVTALNNDGSASQSFDFEIAQDITPVFDPPIQLISVADADVLIDGEGYLLNYGDVFSNFNGISATITINGENYIIDSFESSNLQLTWTEIETSIGTFRVEYDNPIGLFDGEGIAPVPSENVRFLFFAENEGSADVRLRTSNEFGITTSNTFELNAVSELTNGVGTPQDGFFGGLVDSFGGLFPSADSLSNQQKWGYVVLSMLLVSLLGLGLGYQSTGTIDRLALVLATIMNVFVFFYFVSIGYIGYGVIVLIVLGLIGFIYLRSMGAS